MVDHTLALIKQINSSRKKSMVIYCSGFFVLIILAIIRILNNIKIYKIDTFGKYTIDGIDKVFVVFLIIFLILITVKNLNYNQLIRIIKKLDNDDFNLFLIYYNRLMLLEKFLPPLIICNNQLYIFKYFLYIKFPVKEIQHMKVQSIKFRNGYLNILTLKKLHGMSLPGLITSKSATIDYARNYISVYEYSA